MDNIDDSHVVFETYSVSCIDPAECSSNEVCIRHEEKDDVGICQCSFGFKRNIAGIYRI